MPDAARLFEHPPLIVPTAGPTWSGELHGEVGAMQRAIEQRLLSESFAMAVVPLPVRPVEQLIASVSSAVGWLVLVGAAAGVADLTLALLR